MTAELLDFDVITIDIDPTPGEPISPHLTMQFMEPLGATDGSVAAAWDAVRNEWRPDFVDAVRDLAPGAIRWGGILTSYWKWREGVGPRASRRPMPNLLWGGVETNQVGIHEILDLCQRAGADPIIGVNFAADGRPEYLATPTGENRAGTPEEAADLVRYCNDPDHPERRRNGQAEPWGVRLWQVGNETSYPPAGRRFDSTTSARTYHQFAQAIRAADPSVRLIGWGDREGKDGPWWAPRLLEEASDLVDLVALHMMHQRPASPDTVLKADLYRQNYDRAWAELGAIYDSVRDKLAEAREVVRAAGSATKLAITEGHLSLRPHNKCPILREWIAGLYHARILNLYERNADLVEIATFADFFGTAWTVNALMLGSREAPYLLPAGKIARLYRRHGGDRLLRATSSSATLDVAASRRGDRLVLHVVNTNLHRAQPVRLRLTEGSVARGAVTFIAPGHVGASVYGADLDELPTQTAELTASGADLGWTCPAASVSAVELQLSLA